MTGAAGLRRDRLTLFVYSLLGLWGFFLYGFGPTVPLMRDDLQISHAVGGLHATVLSVGALVTGFTGQRLVTRFGRRRLLWSGVAGIAAGTAAYCAGRSVAVTLPAVLLVGLFGSLLLNNSNAVVMDHQRGHGPAALSEGNAVATAVGILAPLVIGASLFVGLGWRPGLLVVLLIAAALAMVFRDVRVPEATPVDAGDHPHGLSVLPRAFWITWGVLLCTISVEFCLSLWAADLLRSRLGLSGGAATAGWSMLLVGMTVSRVAGGRLGLRRSTDWLLMRGLVLLLAGFALFWASSVTWVAVAGLGVAGAGLGVQYPLGASRAILLAGGRSDLATARLSLAAGLAVGLGPFALGTVADHLGVHTAFLLVPALVLLAAVGLLVSRPPPSPGARRVSA